MNLLSLQVAEDGLSLDSTQETQAPVGVSGSHMGIPLVLLLTLLTVVYVVLISAAMQRHLWYDELFTFDIAGASTPSRLMELISRWDLNPPISYFLSRWSMSVIGHGKLGVRLPSIIEFYTASLFLFGFVRRYVGAGFATLAIALLWQNQLYYAVEARPYALVLMCFSILLYCWDRASVAERKSNWIVVWVFGGAVGLLLSHVFASLAFFSILLAELVRFWRTRQKDAWLWAALLVPCLAMLTYIPLFESYREVLFNPLVQASFSQIRMFYEQHVWDSSFLLYAILIALLFSFGAAHKTWGRLVRQEHSAMAAYLAATPIFLNLVLMHGHRAFWPRYCLLASVAICVSLVFVLSGLTRMTTNAAYLAAFLLLIPPFLHAAKAIRHNTVPADASSLLAIRPDLPIVDGYGLTFFEMNHFESPQLLSRLYFLKDRPSAIRYEHSTLFEDFEPPDRLDPEFKITAHVNSYDKFTAEHHQFLLLSGEGDWPMLRLRDDGAEVKRLPKIDSPYSNSDLYLVTLQPK